ncbi:hypothetical protein OYT88_13310 [Sporolactobacillus sp. CQH2019]|uniref:hypothetical protein n=1 Tax=Sporolactobacillus sp. CQH2019 TaxID=3023512 RepID=UPI002368E001|nr:hypothetical protein [Sporolactobacillus sp. CQH2019]MDD9149524.1 hypothetical protein [Sporolactobacillus sp. CQH2019]
MNKQLFYMAAIIQQKHAVRAALMKYPCLYLSAGRATKKCDICHWDEFLIGYEMFFTISAGRAGSDEF